MSGRHLCLTEFYTAGCSCFARGVPARANKKCRPAKGWKGSISTKSQCQAVERKASATSAPVASIDVEYAHFLVDGKVVTAAAEVCLLTDEGAVLLHEYICPDITERGDVRWVGGVKPEIYKLAASFATIQVQLLDLLHGRLLVGYGLSKDLAALDVQHPTALQKDLIKCTKFQNSSGQAQRLQKIAHQFSGRAIQQGKHSAREDANAVLQLYQLHVRDDPAMMSYEELVELELRNMQNTCR